MSETRTASSGPRASNERGNIFARIGLFVRQVIAELRKVVWPTRSQLITYTSVVLVFVLALMAIVGVFDILVSQIVLKVFGGGS